MDGSDSNTQCGSSSDNVRQVLSQTMVVQNVCTISLRESTISQITELLTHNKDRIRCLKTLRRTLRRLPNYGYAEDLLSDILLLILSDKSDKLLSRLTNLCRQFVHKIYSPIGWRSEKEHVYQSYPIEHLSTTPDFTINDFMMDLGVEERCLLELLLNDHTQQEICETMRITQNTFLKIRRRIAAQWNGENRST
jgi:hypothetical protein